jgi:hypothetical protein
MRYGLILVSLSVPFLCAATLALGTIVVAIPGRSEFGTIQALVVSGFLFWTFLVPLVVGIQLIRAAQSAETENINLLHAYRLMRLGSIFSLMPFFAVVAGPVSVWLAVLSLAGKGYGNAADYVIGTGLVLAALSIGYYVLLRKLRRLRRHLSSIIVPD